MLRSHPDPEPVVLGLFPDASGARRALLVLQEHQFPSDEVAATFREPAIAGTNNQQWFGQLRQLYHGEAANQRPNRVDATLGQLDLSPQDAAILERDLQGGGAIVTVTAGSRNQEAQTLLEQHGARIMRSRNAQQAGVPAPPTVVASAPIVAPQPADPDHIQLFGEVLRVRKEKVSSGDVHVRKESVTHMETVQVPVTREHLVVEHGDRTGKNSIRVPLTEERLHIDKDTVLREEYKVGKREVIQNEAVTDSVRRERLLIDDAHAQDGEEQ